MPRIQISFIIILVFYARGNSFSCKSVALHNRLCPQWFAAHDDNNFIELLRRTALEQQRHFRKYDFPSALLHLQKQPAHDNRMRKRVQLRQFGSIGKDCFCQLFPVDAVPLDALRKELRYPFKYRRIFIYLSRATAAAEKTG